MQQTLSIIVIEMLLVVLIALIVMLLQNWRAKNRHHLALEKLIDEVNDGQMLRRKKMVACLTEQYGFDENTAKDLSAVLFGAEKIFFVQFIEQQMQGSLTEFYEQLSELLDSYLSTIAAMSSTDSRSGETTLLVREHKKIANSEDMIPIENEPLPDWGDVFE
jgi:hypothetical protein